jgi:hypothetical protein
LKRLRRAESVKDDAVEIRAFPKFCYDASCVRPIIHVDVDVPVHGMEMLSSVVHVIPGRLIHHATDECGPVPGEMKPPGVGGVFGCFEDSVPSLSLGVPN